MAELRAILDSYYSAWFRYHPEAAVDLGVPGYADRLRPYDDDEIGALTVLHEKLLDSLDGLNSNNLDDDDLVDLELVRGSALLELKKLVERDWRQREPAGFLPIHAIYQLTVRQVDDLGTALKSRLGAIPAYLRGARSQILGQPERVPSVWLESAVAEAHAGAGYFRELRAHPLFARYKLDRLLDTAAHAVEDFARFLETEVGPRAQGEFACGGEYFDMLLRHRHFLDVNGGEIHALGQRLFQEAEAELRQVTRGLRGDDDVNAMMRALHRQHPPANQLLAGYRQSMHAAHAFLLDHDLVTVPAHENLRVVETPVFLRHQIPFAAYLDPQPGDPQQQGYYYVTPATDEGALGEHNLVSLQHTCVHEAWPGHHLQFVTANLNPISSTLPRLLNTSATLYEGWALYCEHLMQEQGFLAAPESRFILLKDRLWRALRIMLDVELQTRGLSIDAAADRMQEALGFTRQQALADLNWYTQAPTVPLGYATGWALITETRARLQATEADFTLKSFHDRLLSSGSIGLPKVISNRFGAPMWSSVKQAVFAGSNSQSLSSRTELQ